MKSLKREKRARRHSRIRSHMQGTANRPRLVAFRSLKHNYLQLVDDENKKVLCGINDAKSKKGGTKTERAKLVGTELAKLASSKGITACVFDRGGYKYHGRVKAMADGAREGGLKF